MPEIRHFFEPATSTLTYVVSDPATRDAVVIDPVLDYDPVAHRVSASSIVAVETHLRESGLKPRLILETHAHADHLSSAQHLKARFGCPVAIGERIREVQAAFAEVLGLGRAFRPDGSQFDRLVADGEEFSAGSLRFRATGLPGHTPACTGYAIGDAVFVGDAIFMPDQGTGRCDFPGGSAESLFDSIVNRLYALPPATKLYVGHDYQPGGRELRFQTTVADSREKNIHLRASTSREEFLAFRRGRDASLPLPKLLYPSIQVNIRGGRLPEAEGGKRFLRIPLEIDTKARPEGLG